MAYFRRVEFFANLLLHEHIHGVCPQSKNAVSTFQITCRVLSFVLENSWSDEQRINPLPLLKGVSAISNICTYNLLVWKWIDEKFDIQWMYLLCFIFVDTAFLLCMAGV